MPCLVGEHFSGEVRDLTSAGQGVVAHPGGRVFFVSGVWIGERGVFEITALRGRTGQARLLSLEQTAAERTEPRCPHHGFSDGACGGCPWQFMDYEAQLQAKQQRVEQALAKLCEGETAVRPIWGSQQTYGYRNRAQLRSDGERIGYLSSSSHELADISDCPILNEHNRKTVHALRERLPNPEWRAAGGGRGRRRRGGGRSQRGGGNDASWTTLHIDDALDARGVIANERRPFRQGNTAQNERMREWLREQLSELAPLKSVVELFAGSGNFTELLVEAPCEKILAVDSFGPAMDELQARGWPAVGVHRADLARAEAWEGIAESLGHAELLLLDPPRDGLQHMGEYLSRATELAHIIYISCDVATFARDVSAARDAGFVLQEVQPLDLFPQTPHVEILSRLSRC